ALLGQTLSPRRDTPRGPSPAPALKIFGRFSAGRGFLKCAVASNPMRRLGRSLPLLSPPAQPTDAQEKRPRAPIAVANSGTGCCVKRHSFTRRSPMVFSALRRFAKRTLPASRQARRGPRRSRLRCEELEPRLQPSFFFFASGVPDGRIGTISEPGNAHDAN